MPRQVSSALKAASAFHERARDTLKCFMVRIPKSNSGKVTKRQGQLSMKRAPIFATIVDSFWTAKRRISRRGRKRSCVSVTPLPVTYLQEQGWLLIYDVRNGFTL